MTAPAGSAGANRGQGAAGGSMARVSIPIASGGTVELPLSVMTIDALARDDAALCGLMRENALPAIVMGLLDTLSPAPRNPAVASACLDALGSLCGAVVTDTANDDPTATAEAAAMASAAILGGLSYPLYCIHLPLLVWATAAGFQTAMLVALPFLALWLDRAVDAPARRALKRLLLGTREAGPVERPA